jgi:hypothetical protein
VGIISTLASGPAKRWTALISGGAYAFVAVVTLLLRPWSPPATSCPGTGVTVVVCDVSGGEPLAVTALGVLAVVAATGISLVVAALAVPLLRLLAGTAFPDKGPLASLIRMRLRHWLAVKRRLTIRARERRTDGAAARARQRLYRVPVQDDLLLPTRIGNSFAAMNGRVWGRHRLDANLCWPLLQQLFDDAARQHLEQTSEQVLGRARNFLWAVLTVCVAVPLLFLDRVHGWPVALVAVTGGVTAALLLAGLGNSVDDYADTVEAAVLRHRDALCLAVGWPLPADTAAEVRSGEELTAYLDRTHHAALNVAFERPQPPQEAPAQ